MVVMVSFKANRSAPELVPPASPTPLERKALSDLDTQRAVSYYSAGVEFFRPVVGDGERGRDPAKAVRVAIGKALVYYYPAAGRLEKLEGGELVVSCTGEGVVFVEADADVRLDELGDPLVPPYPCVEEFICDPGDAGVILGKPLIFMQVTRLSGGGFVIGIQHCHSIFDGFGILQFLRAVTEIARGDEHPAVLPVWERHLLTARNPPNVDHLVSVNPSLADQPSDAAAAAVPPEPFPMEDMVGRYFLFGAAELAALRSHLPEGTLREASTAFELITAATWRCRAASLGYAAGQPAPLLTTMNTRGRWKRDPPLPRGFYGNGAVFLLVNATAGELRGGALGLAGAVQRIRDAKLAGMTDEYAAAMVDLIAARGGPPYVPGWTYAVSDVTGIGMVALDLGWAECVAAGVPMVGDIMCKLLTYQTRCKNHDGEDCVAVSMFLPRPAMKRFAEEIFALCKCKATVPQI